jgi:hypothetical protein
MDISMDTSPDGIRVCGEGDLLELTGVARSTWKNWARKGLVHEQDDGLYSEADIIETLTIRLIVEAVGLRAAIAAWRRGRHDALRELESLEGAAADQVRLVIDQHTWQLVLTTGAEALLAELERPAPFPRGRIVVTLGPAANEARAAFWARALPASDLRHDGRRRAPSQGRIKRSKR